MNSGAKRPQKNKFELIVEEISQYLKNYEEKHGQLPNYLMPVKISIEKFNSKELPKKAEKQYNKSRFNEKTIKERKKKALKRTNKSNGKEVVLLKVLNKI